jgi:hypothetical protein
VTLALRPSGSVVTWRRVQAQFIALRYIAWRNRHARGQRLGRIVSGQRCLTLPEQAAQRTTFSTTSRRRSI